MVAKIETPFGHAMPPAPRHAISTHVPSWGVLYQFKDQDPKLMSSFKNMYPRFWIHPDIVELTSKIKELVGEKERDCFIFPSVPAARDAVAWATSPRRGKDAIPVDQISVQAFQANVPFYVVWFPPPSKGIVHLFWIHAGVGISSRFAEAVLKHLDSLKAVQPDTATLTVTDSAAHVKLRQRIAGLLKRAPADTSRQTKVTEDDVYLFQTGMASIYWVHQYLLSKYASTSALFGFAFHSTLHVLEDCGPGYELFGLGTPEDIDRLEQHLEKLSREGKPVQAIWAEFPANPLLVTPDLLRLRELADKYATFLIVDDTVGSFCNVDVLGVADVVVTSLTKSFSGYADLMAASAVLNPSSKRYSELKGLFSELYSLDFFAGDAEALERNSRNYLERSAIINNNAERLVEYLQTKAEDPNSRVKKVFYPTVLPSQANYKRFMRQPTDEFKPGYGSLFSVELDTEEAAEAFYNNLHVHIGPHFGAPLTLSLGYVLGIYGNDLPWAAKSGLLPQQIRIGVGLEDTQELLEVMKTAVDAADALARN